MKRVRQNKILELIDEYDIDTQEELGKRLHESGFRVTQATISRDIIAGDDTIMCAVRTADLVPAVIEKISNK